MDALPIGPHVSAAEVRDLQAHLGDLLDRVEATIAQHVNRMDSPPPQALKAEQRLLGQLLAPTPPEGDYAYHLQYCLHRVTPAMFYRDAHQCLFAAIGSCWLESGRVDLLAVVAWLREADLLEDAGGTDYLAHLSGETWDQRKTRIYCDLVADRYRRRQLIALCHEVIRDAEDEDRPLSDAMDRLYAGMQSLPRK